MIGVAFTEVEEFLDELDRHAEDPEVVIERATVRATPLYRHRQVNVKLVSVAATFVSVREHSEAQLVRVEAVAGDLWGNPDADQAVMERRDALMAAIAAACERHGLERRAGWFEVPR